MERKKLTEELIKGREAAIQLQILLQKPLEERILITAEDLTAKICIAITEALSELKSGESGEICQSSVTTLVSSPFSDDRKTDDSGESQKFLDLKDGRGAYKRRKLTEARVKLTSTPINDGYSWRKYGQKPILNAKFPRNYFRCTHKKDQGCQATKQVQRTEDDPPQYRTTYVGYHTCKDTLLVPKFVFDSTPKDSFVLNFQSNITTTKQEHHHHHLSFPSSFLHSKRSDLTHIPSSSSDYLDWSDPTTFESSGPTTMFASTPGSDHGDATSDVYTSTSSSQSFDMDLIIGSADFHDAIPFDEIFK